MDFASWSQRELAEYAIYLATLTKGAQALAAASKSPAVIGQLTLLAEDLNNQGDQCVIAIQERRNSREPLVAGRD